MNYTAEDVRRCIGEPDYSRGYAYWKAGKVVSFEINFNDELSGQVQGSWRNIYTQSICLTWRKGVLMDVDGGCSCPVGWNCKHVVSIVLAATETTTAEPQIRLGREAEAWIQELKLTSKVRSPVSPAKIQYDIFYIFSYNVERVQDKDAESRPKERWRIFENNETLRIPPLDQKE